MSYVIQQLIGYYPMQNALPTPWSLLKVLCKAQGVTSLDTSRGIQTLWTMRFSVPLSCMRDT